MPGPHSVPAFHTNAFHPSSVPHRAGNNQPNPIVNDMFGNRDHLRLIGSANEELLSQSGNQAYMQLVMENLRLKNQLFELLYARYNRIPDFSSPKMHGKTDHPGYPQAFTSNANDPAAQAFLFNRASFLRTTFPLAHKELSIILKQEDYPAVRYWISESFTIWLSKQPVVKKRIAYGEISIKDYFLEDKHGNLVPCSMISSIRRYLKTTFTKIEQHMPELLGFATGELDKELLKVLCHELRVMYPELALCSQDWKALVILSRWYSGWRSGHLENYGYGYFESENEESTSNSYTSAFSVGKVPDNSAPDAFSATKHVLCEDPMSATLKRQKITAENPPQIVHDTTNVKQEDQDKTLCAYNDNFLGSSMSQLASAKTKEPGHRRQKVTSSIYPRNLCAKEWKKSHPNGTTKEFRAYWESIEAIERLKWINLSKDLKKEQQMASVVGQGSA